MDTLQAVAAPAEVVPLAPNRLLALAAAVSQNAALSSRLEDNALVDPPRLSSPGVRRQRAPEPWVRQYFEAFIDDEARALSLTRESLAGWAPPAAARGRGRREKAT